MATASVGFAEDCPGCGVRLYEPSNYCTGCGAALVTHSQPQPLAGNTPQHIAARGFAQIFGLHPAIAFFIILVDAMASAVDVATLGISVPVLWLIAAIFSSVIVFMGQKKWYGDDQETSFIKALMVGVLVALPSPFPSFLTVPSAVVGAVQIFRNKK